MKNYMILSLLLASGLLIPVLATAGEGGGFMTSFDTNNDGIVTFDEFNEAAKNKYSNMDIDQNGAVDYQEFQTYVQQRRVARKKSHFETIDTDKDGKISMQDFINYKQKRAEQRFIDMDTNEDSQVSMEEFMHFNKRGHRDSNDKANQGRGFARKRFFSRFDTNGDNLISLQESIAAWSDWFERIDSNQDKSVSLSEVQEYRKNRASSRQ